MFLSAFGTEWIQNRHVLITQIRGATTLDTNVFVSCRVVQSLNDVTTTMITDHKGMGGQARWKVYLLQ